MWKQLAILSVLAAGGAYAQATVASIPFPFHVGGVERPAGDYRFTVSNGVLTVQSKNRQMESVSVVTNSSERPRRSPERGVLFLQYGETCFLSSVWTPDAAAIPVMSKEEKTLKASEAKKR